MSEETNSSESASETAKPESISRPAGPGRNVWLMVVAIVIVIALVATAFVVLPKKKDRELTATIKGDVLQVDAGMTKNLTVVAMLGKKDITNDTETTTIFWTVTPSSVGSFSRKSLPEVPFKAAIQAGTGTVKCTVTYQETPESEEISVVAEKAISVLPPYLDAISISPGAKTIQPGENWTFTATAVSSVGLPISGIEFTWTVTPDAGVDCPSNATTGSSVRLDANATSALGNVSLTATGSYAGKTKVGTSAVTVGFLPPRSMDYVWYDMFNVPIGSWYYKRWDVYKQEEPISTAYPWIFLYHSSPVGNIYTYSLMRLNMTGRNVPEVNTNSWPEFLPILSQTERGGTAEIDWYLQYLTTDELNTRYSSFATNDDGWIVVLNGTVTLDKQAAKMVLNMTEVGWESFDSWWSGSQTTVNERYSKFIVDEAEGRVDIENAYEAYYQLFTFGLDASKVGDKIVLRYDLVTWGMETLIMRWLHECFLPIEMWYEDMNIHMMIGPEWSTIDIDTAVTYALYAYETTDSIGNTSAKPCWVFEPLLGDAAVSSDSHPYSAYDRYAPLSKLNRQPDSPIYGEMMEYDVVPVSWNLTDNETLTLKWPAGNQTFRYRVGQGEAVNISEEMVIRYAEPMPSDNNDFLGEVIVNNTAREIKYVGPINMYDWSKNQLNHSYLKDEWIRMGVLPYGMPWVEWETLDPIKIYLDHFEVDIQDAAPANDDVTFTVTAINNYGFTYYGYNGMVNFTSSDPAAKLRANYTFAPATDKGVHTFAGGAKFQTLGSQTLTVKNVTATVPPEQGSATMTVTAQRNASSLGVDVYYIPAVSVPENVTVTVYDQYGDLFVNYTGTVTFSTNRTTDVTLPLDYVFQLTDAGVHTIAGELVFLATGWFNITANDTVNNAVTGSQTNIWVAASPEVIHHFTLSGIKNMLTRQKSDVRVTAYDQYGKLFKRYNGTIHFSANASGGVFPADYTFVVGDEGYKEFKKGVTFLSQGVFTVTVEDTVVTSATGSQSNIFIEHRPPSETFKMYDLFQQPWGEWWPWRFKGYGTDLILTNESGKYTFIYNADKSGFAGIIYAPYRWNMTGTNMSQVSVHNPEFMPVLGTPDVPGARATIDVYFEYLDWDWWNNYWKPVWNMPDATMTAQVGDGYYPGTVYTVTMNRQAAEEWLGMPQTVAPLNWWAINGGNYLKEWRAWVLDEGNNRLDIWAGYEWPYVDLATKMKLEVAPNGDIILRIGHLGEGYEILMTRWLNETNLCNHEAYYEDLSMHVDYYSNWIDFNFDAVCQYSLRAVKANQSATNEPAWAWQPLLIDYVAMAGTPGGLHPSKYDPWAVNLYPSWNAGDPSFGWEVAYDAGVCYFNLSDYQRFLIQLPLGNNTLGFKAEPVQFDAIKLIKNSKSVPPYDKYPGGSGSNYNYAAYWPLMVNGTMSLGWYGNWTGAPDLKSMYDNVTNTITMVGPMSFENTHHPNGALYMGAPWIEFNVTPPGGILSLPSPAAQAPPTGYPTVPVTTVTVEMVFIALAVAATMVVIAAIATISRRKD